MATINGSGGINEQNYDYTWTPITSTNTVGNGIQTPRNTVFGVFGVFGTFGAGGTVILEGSFDNINFVALKDAFNVAISLTANGLFELSNPPPYMRPRLSAGGDGTTALSAYLHGTVLA